MSEELEKEIRVRFAPSPTGHLHLGGARTALFNYLFAKNRGGKFILRIEDTDKARSTKNAVDAIIDGLKWLGLNWDEGPFFQTENLPKYKVYADKLINEDKAYFCFCTPQELEKARLDAEKKHEAPRYDGKCRRLSRDEVKKNMDLKLPYVVRFKMLCEGETIVHDIARGDVKFENNLLDDFVLIKSDDFPTYNFAAVIDDHLMNISHIIRGDDHLSNTPRQIQIYIALGFKCPKFAHIPMILGSDKTRLSKRHGATSLIAYKDMGYLPDAMFNYLARLGWGHGDQEIFTREELFKFFTLKKVVKTSAVFDAKKLDWVNGQHIRKLSHDCLFELTKPFLDEQYPWMKDLKDLKEINRIKKIIICLQDRMERLTQIVELSDFFFVDEVKYDKESVEEYLKTADAKNILCKLKERLEALEPFEKSKIEEVFRTLAKDLNVKAGEVIHPARVALTGRSDSPPMFDVVELLGKENTIGRLGKTIEMI